MSHSNLTNEVCSFTEIKEAARQCLSEVHPTLCIESLTCQLEEHIDRLPLPTSEYDLAVARCRNIRRYLQSNETGAAKYELRLLLGQLNCECSPVTPESSVNHRSSSSQFHRYDDFNPPPNSNFTLVFLKVILLSPVLVFLPVYALIWFAYWLETINSNRPN